MIVFSGDIKNLIMNKVAYLTVFSVLLFTACNKDESIAPDNGIPVVQAESTYTLLKD